MKWKLDRVSNMVEEQMSLNMENKDDEIEIVNDNSKSRKLTRETLTMIILEMSNKHRESISWSRLNSLGESS